MLKDKNLIMTFGVFQMDFLYIGNYRTDIFLCKQKFDFPKDFLLEKFTGREVGGDSGSYVSCPIILNRITIFSGPWFVFEGRGSKYNFLQSKYSPGLFVYNNNQTVENSKDHTKVISSILGKFDGQKHYIEPMFITYMDMKLGRSVLCSRQEFISGLSDLLIRSPFWFYGMKMNLRPEFVT